MFNKLWKNWLSASKYPAVVYLNTPQRPWSACRLMETGLATKECKNTYYMYIYICIHICIMYIYFLIIYLDGYQCVNTCKHPIPSTILFLWFNPPMFERVHCRFFSLLGESQADHRCLEGGSRAKAAKVGEKHALRTGYFESQKPRCFTLFIHVVVDMFL